MAHPAVRSAIKVKADAVADGSRRACGRSRAWPRWCPSACPGRTSTGASSATRRGQRAQRRRRPAERLPRRFRRRAAHCPTPLWSAAWGIPEARHCWRSCRPQIDGSGASVSVKPLPSFAGATCGSSASGWRNFGSRALSATTPSCKRLSPPGIRNRPAAWCSPGARAQDRRMMTQRAADEAPSTSCAVRVS